LLEDISFAENTNNLQVLSPATMLNRKLVMVKVSSHISRYRIRKTAQINLSYDLCSLSELFGRTASRFC